MSTRSSVDGLAYDFRRGDRELGLLLIHGLGDSRQTWAEAFSSPRLDGYTLCAVDLPGFGESPPLRPFGFEACVDRIEALLGAVLSGPLVVVGHSLGGAVATLLAERREDVGGLVVVEANMTTAPAGSIAATAAEALAGGTFDDWFAEFRRAVESASADESMRRYLGSLDRADVASFAQASAEIHSYSQQDGNGLRYLGLDLPRLYVAGAGVLPVTFEFLERHDLDVLRFPEAGHAVMVDESEAFYGAIADWIDKHVEPKSLRPSAR